jgi:soluble lytic murein transglycosylase-like protein
MLTAGLWAADTSSVPRRTMSVVRADARSGKLVRSVVVAPKPVVQQRVAETVIAPKVIEPVAVNAVPPVSAAPAKPVGGDFNALVESIAAQHQLSPDLIHSVIKVESNYNPNAVSPKGALGLMQLIPATARRFGVSDVFDPVENIQGGVKYLKYLLDLYGNDFRLALAAYNAGEKAVAKYGDVPPYAETRNYVVQVSRRMEENRKASEAAARQKQKEKPVETKPDGPRQIEIVTDADGTVRYVAR